MKSETAKCVLGTSNPYEFKIGDIVVEIKYSKNNKTCKECMLNILKHKIKHI